MKKTAVLFCIIFSFLMISCQNEQEMEEVINVSSISFEKESISIENTQSAACIININPKNAEELISAHMRIFPNRENPYTQIVSI